MKRAFLALACAALFLAGCEESDPRARGTYPANAQEPLLSADVTAKATVFTSYNAMDGCRYASFMGEEKSFFSSEQFSGKIKMDCGQSYEKEASAPVLPSGFEILPEGPISAEKHTYRLRDRKAGGEYMFDSATDGMKKIEKAPQKIAMIQAKPNKAAAVKEAVARLGGKIVWEGEGGISMRAEIAEKDAELLKSLDAIEALSFEDARELKKEVKALVSFKEESAENEKILRKYALEIVFFSKGAKTAVIKATKQNAGLIAKESAVSSVEVEQ